MCVVQDEKGNVVAIDKVKGSYTGTTFPGGHIERGEVFKQSIVREIAEETGLAIKKPRFCGVYHWYRDDVHNILFVYHATEYSGVLTSSDEGRVYWINLQDLKQLPLATGTEHVIEMIEKDSFSECFMRLLGNTYRGELY